MEINEDENNRLDSEFRRILRAIKPYISCIMNIDHLDYYRLWFEKLSNMDDSAKQERNRYLCELFRQVQDGILEYPFTELPGAGLLPPFSSIAQTKQKMQQQSTWQTVRNQTSSRISPVKQPSNCHELMKSNQVLLQEIEKLQMENVNEHHIFEQKKRTAYTMPKTLQMVPDTYRKSDYSTREQNFHTHPPEAPNQASYERFYFQPLPQKRNNVMFQSRNVPIKNEDFDEGSWVDLSDLSSVTRSNRGSRFSTVSPTPRSQQLCIPEQEPTNEMYENKLTELMKIINDLQKQNFCLSEDITKYEQVLNLRNTNPEASIHTLVGEVNSLKSRLQELKDIKAALRNSQIEAQSKWEGIVNSLSKELESTQADNVTLKTEVGTLEKKLEEFAVQKQKDNATLRQKLTEMHLKEVEMLKLNHIKHMAEVENKYTLKLNELKSECDEKIAEFKTEYEKVIQNKNSEIQRLETLIDKECKNMQEEVLKIKNQVVNCNNDENLEKIAFLQKCITKMDKLFKKSEKGFSKQISKLKTEIEIRDKTIQIQLSSQKAELLANTNAERQHELDSTVVQLEERYRKLFETQQQHFLLEKKYDTSLITELRAILAKHNIRSEL